MPLTSKKSSNDANQPHIFLDLDGVMADFDAHAAAQGKYGADGYVNWDKLDYNWWITMPPCDGAKAFYDAVKELATVKFLTAPSLDETSFSGKAAWVQKFVPERGKFILKDLIICPGSGKNYLAKPNHILIDDREKNVQEWIAAGGIGIHHKGDFKETMKALQAAIEKLSAANSNLPARKKSGPVSRM
jgi:5'-nucleotidase